MFHKIALFTALAIFAIGMALKVSVWFRYSVGLQGDRYSASQRIAAAITGIIGVVFSRKVLTLFKVFFVEVIFQRTVYREDFLRWLMHMSIYSGFTMLFFLHALDTYLVAPFFNGYASTINPFLFLREVGGALIVVGIGLAVYRRFIRKVRRPITSLMDINAMIMVALIIFSGFLLEAAKITSHTSFKEMAEEYTVQATEEDISALEAYWAENLGVVASGVKGPFDPAVMANGKALHEANCRQCHANPKWGFGGYAVSVALRPVASAMDMAGVPDGLVYVHFLSALLFLAYLPFSKMFHIFASPLSILANAVMDSESKPVNVATRQMLELDACTHCGACTLRCSVAVAVLEIPNVNILPSEKIVSLKRLASGEKLDKKELRTIQQGIVLCTNCNRCGIVCPVGIRLRDLWFAARERLLENSIEEFHLLSPLAYYRGLERETLDEAHYMKPLDLVFKSMSENGRPNGKPLQAGEKEVLGNLNRSIQANSLSNCYRCGTCTNSCPVVRNYKDPGQVLGLMPHQLMHAIGLRCWDLVFGARMLWDCLGCYQCQENCPQCVSVTDIMYELKNVAISRKHKELSS